MALRFSNAVRELRIHLCQISTSSVGVRDWIETKYINVRKENPDVPILIRECQGADARVWARYDKGVERQIPLNKLSAEDVSNAIKQLVK